MIKKESSIKLFFQQNEKLYKELLLKFPEAVLLFDSTGSVFFANSRLSGILGFDCESEITDISIFNLLDENRYTDFQFFVSDCNSNKTINRFETVMIKKNGTAFFAELNMSKLEFEQKTVFMCIIRDISEATEARDSTTLNLTKTEHPAGKPAHDFNNLIGVITGYADIISQKYKHDPKLRKYSQMIISAATKISKHVEKLFSMESAVKPVTDSEIKTEQPVKKIKTGILVVDDESFMRDAIKEMLSWTGYRVMTCTDGKNAVELFKSSHNEIDLVIIDMIMPEMNGIECYKLLREIKKDVRVLLSTGYRIEKEQQKIFSEGIAGIIHKPFVSEQLEKAVLSALNKY
ncbi:MAG: response regulator [Fibrobacter sp.]|nr:response regulator [Fibrobacter sp.]